MALTAAVTTVKLSTKVTRQYVVKTSEVIFNGAYVALNAGLVENIEDTSGYSALGLAQLNAESITGDGTLTIPVLISGGVKEQMTVLTVAGVADVGKQFFALDENTFRLIATDNTEPVGEIVLHQSGTTVDGMFYSRETIQALN